MEEDLKEKTKQNIKEFPAIAGFSLLGSFVIVGLILAIIFMVVMPPAVSYARMGREFSKSQEMLMRVVMFFEEQEYDWIDIDSDYGVEYDGEMFVSDQNGDYIYVSIEDSRIVKNISQLLGEYKIGIINKNNDAVYFQRWSNRNYGRGFVYSFDGEIPDSVYHTFTYLEPMEEYGWYLYEEK